MEIRAGKPSPLRLCNLKTDNCLPLLQGIGGKRSQKMSVFVKGKKIFKKKKVNFLCIF
jgi:hypothetical protein